MHRLLRAALLLSLLSVLSTSAAAHAADDGIAVYRPSGQDWFLLNDPASGGSSPPVNTYLNNWGLSGDRPVAGDWDGDGKDGIGLYRPSTRTWFLLNQITNNANNPQPDIVINNWGESEDLPVAGDWDGDGKDGIGVFRPSTGAWFLLNPLTNNANNPLPSKSFAGYGLSGDQPVAGDWDGDGRDSVGVFRASDGGWHLLNRDTHSQGQGSDISFIPYGLSGDRPVAGDWDGNTRTSVGVFRPSNASWHFLNRLNFSSGQVSDFWIGSWGVSEDLPVAGDWDGDTQETACDVVAQAGTSISTLGQLYAALQEGQTGCLRSGTTYTTAGLSDDTLTISKRGVTIQSYPGERAKIVGRIVIRGTPLNGKPVRLRKIDFEGAASSTVLKVSIVFDQTDPNVPLNAELTDSDITGPDSICVGSDANHATHGIRIERNRIHDCLPPGSSTSDNHTHGIYLAVARNALIKDNVIYDNGDRGIQLYPDTDGTKIVGNLIDGNRSNLHYGGKAPTPTAPGYASDGNVAYDNILTNPRTCCSSPNGPGPWNFYTLWPGPVGTGNVLRDGCSGGAASGWSGSPAGSGIDQSQGGVSVSNITVAVPAYANRGNKDFRISSGSCAGIGPPATVAEP